MLSRSIFRFATIALGLACSFPVWGEGKWEVGGAAGAGMFSSKNLNGGTATATTGFKPGLSGAFWIGNDFRERFGGEIRYIFQRNNASLQSGSTSVLLPANNHQVTYDFLVYSNSNKARFRPYFLFGGGMKGFQGRGTEQAFQPLLQFAALTRTTQWRAVANVGGGVKYDLSDRVVLRFDIRDNISQFPGDVILAVPPNKAGGVIHNVVPSFGIAYRFE